MSGSAFANLRDLDPDATPVEITDKQTQLETTLNAFRKLEL